MRPSNSATTRRCAADRSSSAAGWCWPPATRPRPTACARRWAARRRDGCARTPWWCRPGCRPTPGPATPCSRCSATPPRSWSRSRSTRRSSTSAGCGRVSGTPVQIAARLRADVRDRVGLPITVGIARTKFLAKVASQEAKPDGLLLVPPDQELAFLHPLPVRRLWGVGAKTAEKLQRARHRTPSPTSPSSASRRWPRWWAARWAASCTRCPATSTAAG